MLPATGPIEEKPTAPNTGWVPKPMAAAPIAAFSPIFYHQLLCYVSAGCSAYYY